MKKDRCEDSGQASKNRLLSDSRSIGIIAKELNMCNEICNECDMYSAKGCILKGKTHEERNYQMDNQTSNQDDKDRSGNYTCTHGN